MPTMLDSIRVRRNRQDDDFEETFFPILGGFTDMNPTRSPQDPRKAIRMAKAQNVHGPVDFPGSLKTIPGFAKQNTSALGDATSSITGGVWGSEVVDVHIITSSDSGTDHSIYDGSNDNEIASPGTDFTIGEDNLVDWTIFNDGVNPMMIACSLQRDTPQRINASKARADFNISGTVLPQFTDVLSARLMMGAPSVGGTVFDDRVYWSDRRDGNLITTASQQFESFEKRLKGRVRGIKTYSDVLVVGDLHNVFLLPPTPSGLTAFGTPQEIAMGINEGPVGHHSMGIADKKLWWRGPNGIYSLDALTEQVKNWTAPEWIRQTFLDFNHADDEYTRFGHWPQQDMVVFSLNGSGSNIRNRMIGVNYNTGALYFPWTRERNALWSGLSSSVPTLYGGGNDGDWYEEFTGTTGDADDAGGTIDADVFTPRHHMGRPGWVKIFGGIMVHFDPVGTQVVTVKYRLDDKSTLNAFSASPYTVSSTAGDTDVKYFPLMKPGEYLQLEFQDAISGEILHVKGYTIYWKLWRRARFR